MYKGKTLSVLQIFISVAKNCDLWLQRITLLRIHIDKKQFYHLFCKAEKPSVSLQFPCHTKTQLYLY